ncbi:MAG: DUF2953 domain-containing protein [Clostridia bacterium]|nr:DUF2953 domain-containing protein [Clostridia bacterium]
MIGFIIAVAIVLLITFLLLSSLTIIFNIENKITLKVKFLGICLFNFNPNKKAKSASHKKVSEKKQNKKTLTSTLKEYAKGKSKRELVQKILEIIKELCIKFGRLLKHLKFEKLNFNLTVASDNAATTAILYGNLCAVVYSICGMLGAAYNFNPKNINVSADFASEQMNLILVSKVKVKLIYIIVFLISAIFSIIKLRIGEVKNGRT